MEADYLAIIGPANFIIPKGKHGKKLRRKIAEQMAETILQMLDGGKSIVTITRMDVGDIKDACL